MKKCICLYDVECINCPLSDDCNAVKYTELLGKLPEPRPETIDNIRECISIYKSLNGDGLSLEQEAYKFALAKRVQQLFEHKTKTAIS